VCVLVLAVKSRLVGEKSLTVAIRWLCAHAGSQVHAAHYRERLQAAAAMLSDLEGTPVFASLDEEVEVHEEITLRLQRRIEDSQKELEEPRMASDWGNRKKAR